MASARLRPRMSPGRVLVGCSFASAGSASGPLGLGVGFLLVKAVLPRWPSLSCAGHLALPSGAAELVPVGEIHLHTAAPTSGNKGVAGRRAGGVGVGSQEVSQEGGRVQEVAGAGRRAPGMRPRAGRECGDWGAGRYCGGGKPGAGASGIRSGSERRRASTRKEAEKRGWPSCVTGDTHGGRSAGNEKRCRRARNGAGATAKRTRGSGRDSAGSRSVTWPPIRMGFVYSERAKGINALQIWYEGLHGQWFSDCFHLLQGMACGMVTAFGHAALHWLQKTQIFPPFASMIDQRL